MVAADIRLIVQHSYDMHQVRAESPRTVHVKTFRDDPRNATLGLCYRARRGIQLVSTIAQHHQLLESMHAVPSHRLDVSSPLSKGVKVVAFELHFRESAEKAHAGKTPKKADKENLKAKKSPRKSQTQYHQSSCRT